MKKKKAIIYYKYIIPGRTIVVFAYTHTRTHAYRVTHTHIAKFVNKNPLSTGACAYQRRKERQKKRTFQWILSYSISLSVYQTVIATMTTEWGRKTSVDAVPWSLKTKFTWIVPKKKIKKDKKKKRKKKKKKKWRDKARQEELGKFPRNYAIRKSRCYLIHVPKFLLSSLNSIAKTRYAYLRRWRSSFNRSLSRDRSFDVVWFIPSIVPAFADKLGSLTLFLLLHHCAIPYPLSLFPLWISNFDLRVCESTEDIVSVCSRYLSILVTVKSGRKPLYIS